MSESASTPVMSERLRMFFQYIAGVVSEAERAWMVTHGLISEDWAQAPVAGELLTPIDSKYSIVVRAGRPVIVHTSDLSELPEGEPLCLFRGRDRLFLPALLVYSGLCVESGCSWEHIDGVIALLRRFEAFARKNPDRMRLPGGKTRTASI